MLSHVARMYLVIAIVSAGGMGSFAHVHPHDHGHGTLQSEGVSSHVQSSHHQNSAAHWHSQAAGSPGTTRLAGNAHHHTSVKVDQLAVERSSVRIGSSFLLVGAWQADIVPVPSGCCSSLVIKASPDLPPRIVLPARAPPI